MMPPLATLIILTPRLHLFSAISFIKSETNTSTNLVGSTKTEIFHKRKEETPLEVTIAVIM